MEVGRVVLYASIIRVAIALAAGGILVEGRVHYHKRDHMGSTPTASPPTPAPAPTTPPGSSSSSSSSSPVVVPSDPYPEPNPNPNPSPIQQDPCVFDVTAYGAVGDGSTDDTAAFQAAWKAACGVESAVILVPSNKGFTITSTIFSGPCKPGLVFQLDGVIMPPEGPDCWPEKDSKRQWLVFYRLDGFTLTGKGTLDGLGQKWWDLPCKPHRGPNGSTLPGPCDSPTMMRFFISSNLSLSGVRFQNSPQFHVKFDGCEGVLIDKLSINSPRSSPNTDGIHIQDTKSVSISNSFIANGDDCISIGPGCMDVVIDGVTCEHSHGISIGSLGVQHTQACVSNITVRNAIIRDSDNGVRIKTWQGGSGSVNGISFENIQMDNTKNCILIDQYYCLSKACRNETSAVYLSDVSYKNIKGTYNVTTAPIHFACSDTVPCTNITMSEVELLPAEGELVDDPFCWNTYGTQETLTIPPIDCFQDGMPESLAEPGYGGCTL